MNDNYKKPSLAEARDAWKEAQAVIPPVRREVITRALAHAEEPEPSHIGTADIVWGFAASLALSLVLAISMKTVTTQSSAENNLVRVLTIDPMEELTRG